MKHFLVYTGARLGLLLVVGALAYAVGMRGFLLVVAAFLGSGLVSFFALRGPRGQFGSDVGGFFRRINDRIDEASRKEDAPVESPPPAPISDAADAASDGAPSRSTEARDGTGPHA